MRKLTSSCILLVTIVLSCLVMAGCGPQWFAQQRPETAEERKAVAELETQILSRIPTTLSGHDQDWDDVITTAHTIAVQTHCKFRLYEYSSSFASGCVQTGKMKEITN